MLRFILLLQLSLINALCFGQDTLRINVDFGGTSSALPWNNINNANNGQLSNLLATNGTNTNIGIEIYDSFNGTNTNGTLTANPNLEIPSSASGDSFFGNQIEFGGTVEMTGGVMITDLDPTKRYDLTFFASRLATDNRETQYTIFSGQADTSLYLNIADNLNDIVELKQWQPKADGTIQVEVTTGPNNDNDFGFFYLGMIRLEFESNIPPQEPVLELIAPSGGEYWQPGKSPEIRWSSQGINQVNIEYSTDQGDTWETVANSSAFPQKFAWTIPNAPSENCLVRISADTLSRQSDSVFQIADESEKQCHIVVLGSSTAAGTGPTSVDSAWVWRYRDVLFQSDTRFQVTNLAKGGFTTYNILPTDSPIPPMVNQSIDTARNITKGLSLHPDALIINLPSNDAANSYSTFDQLANYDLILQQVLADSIPHWICTPQPRNGFSTAQVGIQEEMRDSTFSRFGDFAVDFWTEIADNDGFINSAYDSGDGVHLNNPGHKLLLERILGSEIDVYLLEKKNPPIVTGINEVISALKFYPNPSSHAIWIQSVEPPFDVTYYDQNGRLLQRLDNYSNSQIILGQKGLQYILVKKDGIKYGAWVMKR